MVYLNPFIMQYNCGGLCGPSPSPLSPYMSLLATGPFLFHAFKCHFYGVGGDTPADEEQHHSEMMASHEEAAHTETHKWDVLQRCWRSC